MSEVSAFQFYHGGRPEPKRKEKKEMRKKKLNTPDERSRITEELEMMKKVLVEKTTKNDKVKKGPAPPAKEASVPKPESVAKLSKSAEKRKRKRMSDISNRDENGKSPKVAKLTNEVAASPNLKRKEVNGTSETSKKAKIDKKPTAKINPAAKVSPKPKENKKFKKSSKKEAAVPISNGSVENDVEEEVESMSTKSREVEDELVPVVVEAEKRKSKKNKKSKNMIGGKEEKIPTLVKIPKTSATRYVEKDGSLADGKACFEWMINPIKSDLFFGDSFEKRPIHIKRGQPDYYKHLLSTKVFDNMLRDQNVLFGKNLDVTSYSDGKRETHNPDGRAYGPVVWDFYNNGCSLRLLNPQTFHEPMWKICATLQEYLGSMVGANMYLTPPGTQGFAPHYDDVEVFILQLEGKKRWRLYEPRTTQEKLPRFSSPNFSQEEIGEPCKDFVLEAGDMIYLPRGTIHQGTCLEDAHSLHVTISCHQMNTFGDLLQKMLPAALEIAMENDLEFREGLPHDYLNYMGVATLESSTKKRAAFIDKVKNLFDKLFTYASPDMAADQMSKKFLHDVLPPYLTPEEKTRCVEHGGEEWDAKTSQVVNRAELDPDTEVRLIRKHCLRIVTEEDNAVRIYHCVENTREYHQTDPQFFEIDPDHAEIVEALIHAYPDYMSIKMLQTDDLDFIQMLWENKLLLVRNPLEGDDEDD